MPKEVATSYIEMKLHRAIEMAFMTAEMRMKGILHNTFYILGDPGGGKSMMFNALAKERGYGFLSYEPALERMEKFGGIPDFKWINNELHTVWSVPQIICEIREESNKHKNLIVLLDDWHLADENIQKIGFELFTYYSLNGHQIPKNVTFILAGNAKSAAGAKVALSAIKNRCTVVHTKPDPEYWINNFALKSDIHPAGVSYFMQPSNTANFHGAESTVDPFPSPRSWTAAFNLLSHIEKNNIEASTTETLSMIQGCVGYAAASEFMNYYNIFSKIDTDTIFRKGEFQIPGDSVSRFAFTTAVTIKFYDLCVLEVQSEKKKTNKVEKSIPVEDTYINFLTELHTKHPELAIKSLYILMNKKEDDWNKISGAKIMHERLFASRQTGRKFPKSLEEEFKKSMSTILRVSE